MQDVVSTGQRRATIKTFLFMNARASHYILADLHCRCYVQSAIVQEYKRFQPKFLKELSKFFSVFCSYSLLNETRTKMIWTIIKNELGKYLEVATAWTH